VIEKNPKEMRFRRDGVFAYRQFQFVKPEIRGSSGSPVLTGYAAVFNSLSLDLGGFRERMEPGCFADAIPKSDVRALVNHNSDLVLGRNTSGTLKLWEDSVGLRIEIQPPRTQVAKDLIELVRRGDISQMSFGFFVGKDQWDRIGGENIRTILEVSELLDISLVTFPAYPATSVEVGSRAFDGRAALLRRRLQLALAR